MNSFIFQIPTKLYFGENQEYKIADILQALNVKRPLILIGQQSVIRSGLLKIVTDILDEKKIDYQIYKGITPNPEIYFVREGVKKAREFEADLILAIGGGSVIDVAKGMACSYFYSGDPLDLFIHTYRPTVALPIGVILTHAAAGSEMSTSAVISDSKNHFKQGYNHQLNRPTFAICNPKYTLTLPPHQTAVGIVDILMHTLERYFNKSDEYEVSDYFAEGLLKGVIEVGYALMKNPNNLKARASLMLFSSLSHCGITSIGKEGLMPIHVLEHPISALYPSVAHGAGLAVMWGPWARHYVEKDTAKFVSFAQNVLQINEPSLDCLELAKLGVKQLDDYFKHLNVKIRLRDYGVKKDDLVTLAKIATKNKKSSIYHYTGSLTYEEVLRLYEEAY
ncbi:MAG: iron-containing alcohol dehydrogenase [Bacillota bacterium]|jgi:alcohol dehydrogenase YqhD (iron-dependent ADH family)|nr:iron-containing alcohol dehydrogenase [Bacillota bacterium]HOF65174.1 iron-containing alcohol dehydrogenase [Bacilli bacterium]HPK86297.1 iron-containing alcohol dehydrogenase [Bacilli bacterium]